jgi:hypothetical protein
MHGLTCIFWANLSPFSPKRTRPAGVHVPGRDADRRRARSRRLGDWPGPLARRSCRAHDNLGDGRVAEKRDITTSFHTFRYSTPVTSLVPYMCLSSRHGAAPPRLASPASGPRPRKLRPCVSKLTEPHPVFAKSSKISNSRLSRAGQARTATGRHRSVP